MDMDNANEIAAKMAAFTARADVEGMSEMRRELEMRKAVWGSNIVLDFMLEHGREYAFSAKSYEGPRGEPKQCYANATHLALRNRSLTYVEGKVFIFGIGIDHAWCVDADGNVVDPTLAIDGGTEFGKLDRINGYFGVPLKADYVRKATLWNRVYGLLDLWAAPVTAPKLYELGLEAGQQWVLDQKKKPVRKRKAKA